MPKSRSQITALAPWFGSKRTLAPKIVRQLGEHKAYFEPFCGSMAVLFAKPPSRMEVVNDLHGDLVNLARVIQHPTEGARLYRRLRRAWFNEAEHAEALAACAEPFGLSIVPNVERAFSYFVASWQGRNGIGGTRSEGGSFAVRFTPDGGDPAVRFRSAVGSIPQWRRRLERVQVMYRCGVSLCERVADSPGTVLYCDPPYVVKSDTYHHDFAREYHARLADVLSRFRHARVVVSYYPHPLLDELYSPHRWNRLEITVSKNIRNTAAGGPVKATELLLINGPIMEDAK